MAEERQSVPPLRKPVSLTLNPVHTDTFYIEVVSKTDPAYQQNAPIKRGTIYSSITGANQQVIDQYPLLYFAQETQVGNSDQLVQWRWVTDPLAEDTYNAEISYALESVTSPTYVRTYTVRRDVYDQLEPIAMGTPLTAIIGVRIEAGGGNYTFATGTIDTGAEIEFVISEGVIISGIVTVEGSGVESDGEITITGDGAEARATAIIQPAGAVLIGQKKQEFPQDNPLNEEYVQLVRIYQTLPGPTIHSTRIDDDGIVVDIATTQKVASSIVSGETLTGVSPDQTWTKTTRKQEDNAYVGSEVVETRVIPGNPMPTTRLDDDGIEVSIVRTLKDATEVTTEETLVAGVWTKTYAEPATLTSTINVIDLVVKEVVESRAIPGNPMVTTRVDKDGKEIEVIRTMKDTTLIVTEETLAGGIWLKRSKEAISELIAWEVVEARDIPGTLVPSATVTPDHEVNIIQSTLDEAANITPSSQESAGLIATVEQKEVSDLVSEKVVTVKPWLDEALYAVSIENLIPREFRAFIPTVVVSHTEAGTAFQPVLGTGEFETSQKQLTKLLKEVRTTTLGDVDLPITHVNQELTEQFGGGVLNITYTLELIGTGTIDEGLLVVASTLLDLGNGMEIKETRELDDESWPQLTGQDYDERLDVVIPYDQQVVEPGTGIGLAKTDVKPIDKWREEDRTIDASAAADVLDAYLMTYPSKINVDMPDRLVAVEGLIETSSGEGTDTEIGAIDFTGTSYGISQKLQASAQSSVALSPDVRLFIDQFWGNNIDATHYHFFLPNPVTSADVLTKINALLGTPVSDWPKFNPVIVTLIAYGERRSLNVSANSGGSAAAGGSSSSSTTEGGVGYSTQVGTTLKTVRISPTIHPEIVLTGTTSDSESISASATAEAEGLGPESTITQMDTATAYISPTTIDATLGATDWPEEGLFLYRVDAQPYRYGYVQFHVVIVDAEDFPINT